MALCSLGAVVAIAVAVCSLIDRFTGALWRWRNPPEKLAAERHASEQRLLHPDWAFYERHLQRAAPSALRELFADRSLLLSGGFDNDESHSISTFEPLDELSLVETRQWLGVDVVPFATSDGDCIYLRPGPSESDAVFIAYDEYCEGEELAPDVQAFLQRLRHAN